jgi:hypothetical protein
MLVNWRISEMEFDSESDYAEWIGVTYGIIKAFEDRGWALYELGPGPVMFNDIRMIDEFIQYGRAEDVLKVGIRYMILPLVRDSKDPFQIHKAVEEVTRQVRAPYFFNCKQDTDGGVEVLSRHLIDSVAVEPPFLEMSVDVRFGPVMEENTVEIPLGDAATVVRKQIMLALRRNKVSKVQKVKKGLPDIKLVRRDV